MTLEVETKIEKYGSEVAIRGSYFPPQPVPEGFVNCLQDSVPKDRISAVLICIYVHSFKLI